MNSKLKKSLFSILVLSLSCTTVWADEQIISSQSIELQESDSQSTENLDEEITISQSNDLEEQGETEVEYIDESAEDETLSNKEDQVQEAAELEEIDGAGEEIEEEKIILPDYQNADWKHYVIADQLIGPLYDAIGQGASGVDLSYLGYSYDQLQEEFAQAIFGVGFINHYITSGGLAWSVSLNELTITPSISEGIKQITLNRNGYCSIEYSDRAHIVATSNRIQAAINPLMNELDGAKTDLEKELLVHDYLVLNCEYDYDNLINGTVPSASYSAYGVLVNRVSVCNGYAYAMKYLLNKAGVECEVVKGTGNGGAHAWNIVKIDGNYYYVDTTWDDPLPDRKGEVNYSYFNVTANEMKKEHNWNTGEYPAADSTEYSVFKDNPNGIYYNGAFYYIEDCFKICKYDVSSGSTKVLVEDSPYISILKINKESQCVQYTLYDGTVLEIALNNEVPQETISFVKSLYQKTLNQECTDEEALYWAQQLDSMKLSAAEMIADFTTQAAFESRKLTNAQYVDTLYGILFDKTADTSASYWVQQLDKGSTRMYVLSELCKSEEFKALCSRYKINAGQVILKDNVDKNNNITQFVYRFYGTCMGRTPDLTGQAYWVDQLSNQQMSVKEIVYFFVHSDEMTKKNLSDEDYLEVLYKSFFDRASDTAGKTFWLDGLKSGRFTKDTVLDNFVYSKEFNGICGDYNLKLQ